MHGIPFEELVDSNKVFSDAVGRGVRIIAFGVIAAVWAVLTADRISLASTGLWGLSTPALVTYTFIFASTTLLADIVQYVAAYWMTSIGINRWDAAEQAGKEIEFFYNKTNLGTLGICLYWLNRATLFVKIMLALAAGATFVALSIAIELS